MRSFWSTGKRKLQPGCPELGSGGATQDTSTRDGARRRTDETWGCHPIPQQPLSAYRDAKTAALDQPQGVKGG